MKHSIYLKLGANFNSAGYILLGRRRNECQKLNVNRDRPIDVCDDADMQRVMKLTRISYRNNSRKGGVCPIQNQAYLNQ